MSSFFRDVQRPSESLSPFAMDKSDLGQSASLDASCLTFQGQKIIAPVTNAPKKYVAKDEEITEPSFPAVGTTFEPFLVLCCSVADVAGVILVRSDSSASVDVADASVPALVDRVIELPFFDRATVEGKACVSFDREASAGGGIWIAGGTLVVTWGALIDVVLRMLSSGVALAAQISPFMAIKTKVCCMSNGSERQNEL